MKHLIPLAALLVLGFGCNATTSVSTSEPLTIPETIENNCVGFVTGGPDEAVLIHEIGGAWARPHPGPFAWQWVEPTPGDFDFSMADEFVNQAQENEVAILGTIWPFADWDQAVCHSTECNVSTADIFYPEIKDGSSFGIPVSRCAPCSMDNYKNFVTNLVERYDGDGINDMPGLIIPVKYWEILNEPEMNSTELTFFKGTPEEYAELIKISQSAISATCSDCQIVQAGAAGIQSQMLSYWRELYSLGIGDYLDIANIHYINSGDSATLNVKDFKKLLIDQGITKPIWVTEAEYGSENQIASSFTGALAAGADKVFFTQFKVGSFGLPAGGKYSTAYSGLADRCPLNQ